MYCLLQRELHEESSSGESSPTPGSPALLPANGARKDNGKKTMPEIFTDPGYALLGTSILSTSNCGNPALRLFGFAPVAADGFGIGYIIKDDAISIAATSKHLQTKRLLATIQTYLLEIQKMLVTLYKAANEREDTFVDHSGAIRDLRSGTVLVAPANHDAQEEDDEDDTLGMPAHQHNLAVTE
jgi:carnitine O-acetyltransferase